MGKNKINTTGYLKGSSTENNNFNIIPSNKITMDGVNKKLFAIKLDKNGLPMGMQFMNPGEEFEFGGTSAVVEIPVYQPGGRHNTSFVFDETFLNPPVDPSLRGFTPTTPFTFPQQVTDPTNIIELTQVQLEDDSPITEAPFAQLSAFGTRPVSEITPTGEVVDTTPTTTGISGDLTRPVATELEEFEPSELNLREFQDERFFNPYAGVDIPTAATTLGQSIGRKDPLGIVGSSLKLAAGLGRNVVGGLAGEKRTQATLQDYYRRLREPGNITALQTGGKVTAVPLTDADIPVIKEDIKNLAGVSFTDEGVDALFERTVPAAIDTPSPVNLGKYKNVGYFNVISSAGDSIVLSNTAKNPHNAESIKQLLPELRKLNPGRDISINFDRSFQKGGKMTKEQLLTGEFITGVDPNNPLVDATNAEIEKGEYYATAEGDIAEVVGKTHNQGGEKVIMEENDRVLTDHTKLGAKNAKYIRDNFDIEVKAKHTYSDVLDKYRTKTGFSKLVKEEEELLKRLEQQEETENSQTKDLNTKFLSEKLKEVSDKKSPIEEGRKFLFNKLYELQEKQKPASERDNSFQEGGAAVRERVNPNLLDPTLTTQPFTQQELSIAGTVTPENYVETITNLHEQFPEAVEEVFDIVRDHTGKIAVARQKQGKSIRDLQTGIQSELEGKLEQAEKIKDPERRQQATDFIRSQMFGEGRFNQIDDILGNVTASKRNIDLALGLGLETAPAVPLEGAQIEVDPNLQILPPTVAVEEGLDTTTRDALNIALLPDQLPMIPEGTQPVLKTTRRYDRIEAQQIDPEPFIQNARIQAQVAKDQTEGLSPNVRAAALANIDANTQKAVSDALLNVETANLQARSQAEQFNARVQAREEDARVLDLLSFEKRQLTADAKTDLALQEYFDKLQQVNIGNFRTINALNDLNQRYDNIQYTGSGYEVAPAPEFGQQLDMNQINQIIEEYEKSRNNKK